MGHVRAKWRPPPFGRFSATPPAGRPDAARQRGRQFAARIPGAIQGLARGGFGGCDAACSHTPRNTLVEHLGLEEQSWRNWPSALTPDCHQGQTVPVCHGYCSNLSLTDLRFVIRGVHTVVRWGHREVRLGLTDLRFVIRGAPAKYGPSGTSLKSPREEGGWKGGCFCRLLGPTASQTERYGLR